MSDSNGIPSEVHQLAGACSRLAADSAVLAQGILALTFSDSFNIGRLASCQRIHALPFSLRTSHSFMGRLNSPVADPGFSKRGCNGCWEVVYQKGTIV